MHGRRSGASLAFVHERPCRHDRSRTHDEGRGDSHGPTDLVRLILHLHSPIPYTDEAHGEEKAPRY